MTSDEAKQALKEGNKLKVNLNDYFEVVDCDDHDDECWLIRINGVKVWVTNEQVGEIVE